MKLGPILLAFGLFYIVSGLIYKLPVAAEPLKVVGAISVTARADARRDHRRRPVRRPVLPADGLTGLIKYVEKYFPVSLVRGVQLGLALLLLVKGGQYITGDWQIGILAVAVYLVILLADRMKCNWLPGCARHPGRSASPTASTGPACRRSSRAYPLTFTCRASTS